MRKRTWLILVPLALLALHAAYGIGGLALGAAVFGVPYAIGCKLHPRTRHGACGGTGTHRSAMFPWAERRCRGCVGGRQIRHGTRVLGMPHSKAEHQRNAEGLAKRRQERTWR